MTISSSTSRNDYIGAGIAGPFAFGYRIFSAADLAVVRRTNAGAETTLAYPLDFQISVGGVGNRNGGSVTLSSVLAVGESLAIRRVLPLTQTTDLRNLGSFLPETIEDQLDRLVMIDQQQQDELRRSLRLSSSYDPAGYNLTLPAPAIGTVLVGTGTGYAAQLLDSSANVALPAGGRTVATLSAYLANNAVINAIDYGVPSTGTDATAALNALLAIVPAGAHVVLPGGAGRSYMFTGTVLFSKADTHLIGEGVGVTNVVTNPTVSGTPLFKFSAGAAVLFRNSVVGMTISGHAGAAAKQKIAFEIIDTSETRIENVRIAGLTGNNGAGVDGAGMLVTPSTGFWIKGRELLRIVNVTNESERPIRISANPNSATLPCDHMHVTNYYALCKDANGPHVLIDPTMVCTTVTFDGQQAWVFGKYGIYRADADGTAGASYQFRVSHVRMEQATAGGYFCYWIGNIKGGLYFDDCQVAFQTNGWYLRHVQNAEIRNCLSSNVTGEVLNVDSTCVDIFGRNNHFVTGSTVSLGTCVIVYQTSKASGRALGGDWLITNPAIFTQPQFLSPTLTTPHVVGMLRFDDAVAQVRSGSTSWAVRSNNEGSDNLLVLNTGDVVARATMKATQYYVGVNPVVGPRLAAVASPNAQTPAYVQADVASLKTAIDTIIARLQTHGLIS